MTDDSPFFFNFHHIGDPATAEDSSDARAMDTRIPLAPAILRELFLQVSLLAVALVWLPLFVLRRRGLSGAGTGSALTFFLCVGAGFMLPEISSIQRLALFLGHPTDSLSVVLFSFLFFAGLGSLVAVALGLLAPVNFTMGLPFPLALARLRKTRPVLVPWAIGANGGAPRPGH